MDLVFTQCPRSLGVVTINGAKSLVDFSENLYLYYFEKSSIFIYNELFVHIL
jgi:hypothetical protein